MKHSFVSTCCVPQTQCGNLRFLAVLVPASPLYGGFFSDFYQSPAAGQPLGRAKIREEAAAVPWGSGRAGARWAGKMGLSQGRALCRGARRSGGRRAGLWRPVLAGQRGQDSAEGSVLPGEPRQGPSGVPPFPSWGVPPLPLPESGVSLCRAPPGKRFTTARWCSTRRVRILRTQLPARGRGRRNQSTA